MPDSVPDPLDTVTFSLFHNVSFSRCNISYYEQDSISVVLDNMKQEGVQFNSVPEALIWLFEKETGKKLDVKHYYVGGNACA